MKMNANKHKVRRRKEKEINEKVKSVRKERQVKETQKKGRKKNIVIQQQLAGWRMSSNFYPHWCFSNVKCRIW